MSVFVRDVRFVRHVVRVPGPCVIGEPALERVSGVLEIAVLDQRLRATRGESSERGGEEKEAELWGSHIAI